MLLFDYKKYKDDIVNVWKDYQWVAITAICIIAVLFILMILFQVKAHKNKKALKRLSQINDSQDTLQEEPELSSNEEVVALNEEEENDLEEDEDEFNENEEGNDLEEESLESEEPEEVEEQEETEEVEESEVEEPEEENLEPEEENLEPEEENLEVEETEESEENIAPVEVLEVEEPKVEEQEELEVNEPEQTEASLEDNKEETIEVEEKADEEVVEEKVEEAPKKKAAPKKTTKASNTAKKATKTEETPKKSAPKKKAAPKEKEEVLERPFVEKATEPKTNNRFKGKFEIMHDATGYKYNLKASNGESLIVSENYTTLNGCKNAIKRLQENVKDAEIKIEQDKNKNYQFHVYKGTRVVAHSANYSTKLSATNASKSFMKFVETDVIKVVESEETENQLELVDLTGAEIATDITGKIVISSDGVGFLYKLYANNGQTICMSPVYKTLATIQNSVEKFKEAVYTGKFYVLKDKNSNYQFKLYSKSNRLILTGESFSTAENCKSNVASVYRFAKNAIVEVEGQE